MIGNSMFEFCARDSYVGFYVGVCSYCRLVYDIGLSTFPCKGAVEFISAITEFFIWFWDVLIDYLLI